MGARSRSRVAALLGAMAGLVFGMAVLAGAPIVDAADGAGAVSPGRQAAGARAVVASASSMSVPVQVSSVIEAAAGLPSSSGRLGQEPPP